MTEVENSRGISRRTIARTAAWSVPAVAVVAAAPAYAASAFWDASITHHCDGGVLQPVTSAGFTITNVGTATMPAGTKFNFIVGGLVSANVFQNPGDLINLFIAGLVQVGTVTVFPMATQSDVPPGGTATLTLPSALLKVQVLTSYQLILTSTEPAGASSSNNSDSFPLTNVSVGGLGVITTCS